MVSTPVFIYLAYFFFFWAIFIVSRHLFKTQDQMSLEENFDNSKVSSAKLHAAYRFFKLVILPSIVPYIKKKDFFNKLRISSQKKILSAGLRLEIGADELIALKFTCIFVGMVLNFFFFFLDLMGVSLISLIAFALFGWFFPDLQLNSLFNRRKIEILKSLPFIVDLLALSTEAGLDFIGAIAKVVDKAKPSPLVQELENVLREISLGAPRMAALRDMSLRINMQEISSFVAILVAADELGAPIGKVLRQQSEQMRNSRLTAAEKAGAIASQKVILPLVIFVMPAVMIMIFGPFLLSIIYGGGGL